MRFLLLAFLLTIACNQPASVEKQKAADASNTGQFVHMVFFKLKSDADTAAFLQSVQTFKTIEVVRGLEVGHFQDTGGPSSELSERTLVVRLTFDDLAAFRVYEKHPVHLASIEATKDLLAGPPVGYDYVVK